MELDDSVVGLNRDKMMKVSDFRTRINVALMDSDQSQSLQLNDAVKYLHATKFDITKAEDIYHNYQSHRELYKLAELKCRGQVLNSEIRTRKLEVLGTRDKKGSLMLLYTASRHTPKSHDSTTSMQLFFLIFDQISESTENQSKGITVIMDMRDSHPSSFDGHYANNLFSLFHNGYPIFINCIYIIEAPSFFTSLKKLRSYIILQQQGKIIHCTVNGLSSHIPSSSLPSSLNGSLASNVSSFVPLSEALTHSLSPVHHNTPITPPPRRGKMHEETITKGLVNKMRDHINPPIRSNSAGLPTVNKPIAKPKPNKINEVKSPKPLPPPRTNGDNKTKVPVFPPKSFGDSGKKLPVPFKKSKSFDEMNDENHQHKQKQQQQQNDLIKSVEVTSTTTTKTSLKIPKTTKTTAKTVNDKPSKHIQPIKIKNINQHPLPSYDDQHPPPSCNAPSPPSESKPSPHKYVNVNISKFLDPSTTATNSNNSTNTVDDHLALPYKVTTTSAVEPSKTTPMSPPASSTPIDKVKLRDPIITKTSGITTPTLNDHNSKKKPSSYENVFFIKEPIEDEGECLNDDEVIYENFGPDEGNKWMGVTELEQYITRKGKNGLSAEYYKLKNDPLTGSADVFRMPYNTSKNRYKDVVCYDNTRVIMNEIDGVEGSDYIHANYVNGFEKKQAFILTQGPLKRTVSDYWRMLWEKEVFVVVMTTKCCEMGKIKCTQYWPDEGKSPAIYGGVAITVLECQHRSSFEYRKLSVQCNNETRILMHYQYIAWPDYGVPETGKDIVELLYTAREAQESFGKYIKNPERFPVYGPPLVIHCSAGIGRSGTFCALDYCIDELRMKGRVNVQHCVRQLRQQRAFAIQTDEQYKFCYDTVLEYGRYLKTVLKL